MDCISVKPGRNYVQNTASRVYRIPSIATIYQGRANINEIGWIPAPQSSIVVHNRPVFLAAAKGSLTIQDR